MSLRVSSGIYKGKKLQSMPGKSFRPISERIKLALFSIINDRVPGSSFLDLFAGVGTVGIEALSRGAKSAVFIEKNMERIKLLKSNIDSLGLEESKAQVINADALLYKADRMYDVIFAGPPYMANHGTAILNMIKNSLKLKSDLLLVLQRHSKERVIHEPFFKKTDERTYGITSLDFYCLSD